MNESNNIIATIEDGKENDMRKNLRKNKIKETQSVLSNLTPTTAMTVVGDHNCSAADKKNAWPSSPSWKQSLRGECEKLSRPSVTFLPTSFIWTWDSTAKKII